MKVLHVFRTAQGGIKRHLQIIGLNLQDYGITPLFCGPANTLDKTGVQLDYDLPINDNLNTSGVLSNINKVRDIIAMEKPDVIHSHGYKASLIAYGAAKFFSIPWICTIHNFDKSHHKRQVANYLTNSITKAMFNEASLIICVSNSLSKEIAAQGIDETKIRVIYNGIPIWHHHYITSSSLSRWSSKRVIACIGRLIPDKGIDNFIKAVKYLIDKAEVYVNFMDLHFVVVGDGPWKQYYQRLAWDLKIAPYISFTGNRDDIADILKHISLLCIPSRYEGQSITAVEAMASFCPVIASKTGGLEELISHGNTGLLVSKEDHVDLARKIIFLVKNRKLSRRLAFKAYQHVIANFSDINMMDQIAQLYHEVSYDKKQLSK